MQIELSVEEKQKVTKVEYGVVYVVKSKGSEFEVGTKVVLQEDDGSSLPYFNAEDGSVLRGVCHISRLEVYKPQKLKLEVGKKYRMRNGEITSELQSRDSRIYPFTDGDNIYTKDGMYWNVGGESEHDLIEEAIETKIETKQETKEMKYYRVIKSYSFSKGDIVVLHYDDRSDCPEYKNVNTGETLYTHKTNLEEINVKTTTFVKGPASRMIKQLEDEGWELEIDEDDNEIGWTKAGDTYFRGDMLQYCGKPKPSEWSWNDEWLETKYEFESLVKPKPSLNHRQFLIDFMKKKLMK